MNPALLEFEDFLARKPAEVCRVLGVAYSTYAGYRATDKPLPESVTRHIEALRLLEADVLNKLVRERLRGAKG